MLSKRFILLVGTILVLNGLFASNPFVFSNADEIISIKDSDISIYTDLTNKLSFEEVEHLINFKENPIEVPNLGVSSNTHWLKFTINNQSDHKDLLLQLSYPIMDVAELYSRDANGSVEKILLGADKVFSERKYKHPNFLFDVNFKNQEVKTFYLKIKSVEQILVPLKIGLRQEILESNNLPDILFGIYFGVILVMFLYNLFLYLVIRDKNYLYYIFYVILVGFVQVTFPGYTFQYLWSNNLWLSKHALLILGSSAAFPMLMFSNNFLQTKRYYPKLYKVSFILYGMYLIAFVASFFDGYLNFSYKLIDVSGGLISFFVLLVAILITKKGYRPARFFLIAWSIFLVGLFAFVFRSFGVFPYNIFTNFSMPIGSAIETVLLSFALADRINTLKKEELARKQEIERLKYKALTSQMNPHFIFNSLNSIRSFVLNNESKQADSFLTKFAGLMRSMLDNSRQDTCLFVDEIQAIINYLELEKLRFQDKFSYTIIIDPKIKGGHIQIPSLLIQPFIENAILHGVVNSKEKGEIKIEFNKEEDYIVCVIEDNGVGRKASKKLKEEQNHGHKSVGMLITQERLEVLGGNSDVKIIDMENEQGISKGTRVEVKIFISEK